MLMKKKSNINLANENADIFMVLGLIGMSIAPVYDVHSIKVHCPFGDISHSDFGTDRAMRIYPGTNSAYCFACQKLYTSVNIYALSKDIGLEEAASDLLRETGYQPQTLEEMWASAQPKPQPPDLPMLGLALRVFCERIDPAWQTRQFEPEISSYLDSCLSLLSAVRTEQDVAEWLKGTKQVMKNCLNS